MSTWYRTGGFSPNPIEAVEVVRETAKRITYINRRGPERANKRGSRHNYFATWEEAHAFLVKQAERYVEGCSGELQQARSKLGQLESLRKPEGKS